MRCGVGRRLQHGTRERVLAAALQRRGVGEQRVAIAIHREGLDEHRAALGQRAGLVERDHGQVAQRLERDHVLDQDAVARRDAGADHDRRRRGEAECARAGNDEHRHRVQQRGGERRAGDEPPAGERRQRDRDDDRHEDGADPVDEALDRRLFRLRRFDEPHDARERRLGADRRRAHDEQPLAVDRAAGDAVARRLGHRQALAGEQRLVDVAAPVEQQAVDRQALAGAHDDLVADHDLGERDLRLDAAAAHARRVRAQRLQRADRIRRLPLGARLEPLAEQHQSDHDGSRLEVQRRHRVDRASPA